MEIKLTSKQKITVTGSEDIYPIMQKILCRENQVSRGQEHFWMVGLNQANKILYIELLALGASNMVMITPREAFRMSIYKLAIQVILVHNHPSGEIKPSEKDKDFTDHFIQAGKFLNIEVIEHLIISEKQYYSFVDSGLFEELKKSKKYVLPYELEAKAKQEGLEEGIEKGLKEGERRKVLAIANKAIREGLPMDTIVKLTGLSIEEIKRL